VQRRKRAEADGGREEGSCEKEREGNGANWGEAKKRIAEKENEPTGTGDKGSERTLRRREGEGCRTRSGGGRGWREGGGR